MAPSKSVRDQVKPKTIDKVCRTVPDHLHKRLGFPQDVVNSMSPIEQAMTMLISNLHPEISETVLANTLPGVHAQRADNYTELCEKNMFNSKEYETIGPNMFRSFLLMHTVDERYDAMSTLGNKIEKKKRIVSFNNNMDTLFNNINESAKQSGMPKVTKRQMQDVGFPLFYAMLMPTEAVFNVRKSVIETIAEHLYPEQHQAKFRAMIIDNMLAVNSTTTQATFTNLWPELFSNIRCHLLANPATYTEENENANKMDNDETAAAAAAASSQDFRPRPRPGKGRGKPKPKKAVAEEEHAQAVHRAEFRAKTAAHETATATAAPAAAPVGDRDAIEHVVSLVAGPGREKVMTKEQQNAIYLLAFASPTKLHVLNAMSRVDTGSKLDAATAESVRTFFVSDRAFPSDAEFVSLLKSIDDIVQKNGLADAKLVPSAGVFNGIIATASSALGRAVPSRFADQIKQYMLFVHPRTDALWEKVFPQDKTGFDVTDLLRAREMMSEQTDLELDENSAQLFVRCLYKNA